MRRAPKITADQFTHERLASGFTREEAAEFLGVTLRTIGHWETGQSRPLYSAFKLLRSHRNGHPTERGWEEFRFTHGYLFTPEGRRLHPADLGWIALLARRADAYGQELAKLRAQQAAASQPRAPARACLAVPPAGSAVPAWRAPSAQAVTLTVQPLDRRQGAQVAFGHGQSSPIAFRAALEKPDRGLPLSNRGVSETERGTLRVLDQPLALKSGDRQGEGAGRPCEAVVGQAPVEVRA